MGIDKELIDKLLADYKGPEDLIGEQGLLKQLTKALVERAMHAELTHRLSTQNSLPWPVTGSVSRRIRRAPPVTPIPRPLLLLVLRPAYRSMRASASTK